jgi:DNA repair protein RecO (recombination protein O)
MPARESEALVLRTYPYREADLIVSFFTRDRGKLRGIARGVRRPKSNYGASLERLAHVRIHYFQKQTLELVRIDRAEPLSPPLVMLADYPCSLALDYIAEVAEDMLPEHEPNDAYFRLVNLAVRLLSRASAPTKRTASAACRPGWSACSPTTLCGR